MSFLWPVAFVGVLIIPLGIALYLLVQRRRARFAVRFTRVDILATVSAEVPQRRRLIATLLLVPATLAMIASLARPQASFSTPRDDATIILTMDSSESMEDEDVKPTRLAAAKEAANRFLEEVPENFHVGVVSFSGRVDVLASPNTDRKEAIEAIESLRPRGPTALGEAIAESVALDADQGPSGAPPVSAVLLLSDGRDTVGSVRPLEAAEQASQLGLPVFTIALGPPPPDPRRPNRVKILDPPDHATLKRVADMTGGLYFGAATSDELQTIYESLRKRLGFETERRELTYAFAGVAAVFLIAAVLTGARSWRFP